MATLISILTVSWGLAPSGPGRKPGVGLEAVTPARTGPPEAEGSSSAEPSPASAQGSLLLHSHGLSEAGPRQLLQLPQRLQPVDMGRARRVRPGRRWDKASVGLGLLSILCFAASTFP